MKRQREVAASASNKAAKKENMTEIPSDIIRNIYTFLPARYLFSSCSQVSKSWHEVFTDETMWRTRYQSQEWLKAAYDTVDEKKGECDNYRIQRTDHVVDGILCGQIH
jgi:hypothetical protein